MRSKPSSVFAFSSSADMTATSSITPAETLRLAASGMVFHSIEWYSTHMAVTKTRRQIAAEETQRAIVEAAHALFLERGYHATSVGSKRDLLSRVLDYAAAGERAPTPVPTFMRDQTEREPDSRRVIDQLVEFWRGGLERTAPVFQVIRQAAALDPEVAAPK